ncbi:chloride channel protein, partial [candidate division KSB1 bacterium]
HSGIGSKILKTSRKIGLPEDTSLLILALIVGIGGGLGAVLFRKLIRLSNYILFDIFFNQIKHISFGSYLLPIVPGIGGLFVGLMIYYFAREARGHGVPEVMDAVANKGGIIRPRVVFVKMLASAICIGSGGSTGREGPIIQIGSALGSSFGQFFKLSTERIKILLGCGAAAGMAATFNAPIAGTLFPLEIILGDFSIKTFSPIILSSVIATAVSWKFLGSAPAFILPEYKLISNYEFLLYLLMGIIMGFVGVAYIRTLYYTDDRFLKLKKIPEYVHPAIGGILMGFIAIKFPQIMGNGYEAIEQALHGKLTLTVLLFLLFAKPIGTSLTLGSGGSGGIFAPSLFIGAVAGGCFGKIANIIFPSITAPYGAYSLVAMGAVVGAVTHAPLTGIIIIFELTNNYRIILPLMFCTITSTVIAKLLLSESIYTMDLLRKGIRFRKGRNVSMLEEIPVSDVMTRNFDKVSEETPIKSILNLIQKSRFTAFPVTDSYGYLKGIITFNDIRSILFEEYLHPLLIAKDIATFPVVTIKPDDNLSEALRKMEEGDFDLLPVVKGKNGQVLMGVITRDDLLNRYHKEFFVEATKK